MFSDQEVDYYTSDKTNMVEVSIETVFYHPTTFSTNRPDPTSRNTGDKSIGVSPSNPKNISNKK